MKTKMVVSGLILVIVALAVSTVLGGAVAQEYTGQQWEYQVESFAFPTASPTTGVMSGISVPAGTPPPPPDMAMDITRRLNELGAEGWELVSSDLLPGEDSPAFVWIFKRPAD